MPSKTAAAKFKDDEIAVARTSIAAMVDGTEYFVKEGERLLGSDPVVKSLPQFFQQDGVRLPPWQPEYPVEPPAGPKSRPKKLLRAKKNWTGVSGGGFSGASGGSALVVTKGDIVEANSALAHELPPKLLAELFEEVTEA